MSYPLIKTNFAEALNGIHWKTLCYRRFQTEMLIKKNKNKPNKNNKEKTDDALKIKYDCSLNEAFGFVLLCSFIFKQDYQ